MFHRNINNLVYFSSETQKKGTKSDNSLSNEKLKQLLQALAQQSIKEQSPDLQELESILQSSIKSEDEQTSELDIQEKANEQSSASLTKLLQEKGYLKDNERWLTNKGFFQIGEQILNDVMKNLQSSDFGLHETQYSGTGNVTIDTTKKFELGDDLRNINVSQTILNSIERLSKTSTKIDFPILIDPEDFEQYETLDDVSAAVVYCIDLSSTMKYSLGKNGRSRIEAAKKALWSLYVLNKKFFPNDSVYVVGFASMASLVNPYDIPFLKTYDANDNFLHYTNYQAAFRLARKILQRDSKNNKRIVLITDGQPSACFVDNDYQKSEIVSEKPYSNFYSPDASIISKIHSERNLKLDSNSKSLVYLCYRYKKVDPRINDRTILEAKKCKREGIDVDTIVISEEIELLDYIKKLEKELKGKTYHINQENMDKVLVTDYLYNTKKILNSNQNW